MNRGSNSKSTVRQTIRVKITRPVAPSWETDRLREHFFQLLFRLLTALFVSTAAAGIFLHWRIGQEQEILAGLTEQDAALRKEHAALQAQRNELMSKSRIAAAAAVRLGLQLPEKEQVHRLY